MNNFHIPNPTPGQGQPDNRTPTLSKPDGPAQAVSATELSEREELCRQLIECSQDCIFSLARDGTISSLNPAFEKITGWPREAWIGRPYQAIVHPEDAAAAAQTFEVLLRGEIPPVLDVRCLAKSGAYVFVELAAIPVKRNGEVQSAVGIARDVTERKRSEEQLRMLSLAVEQTVDSVVITNKEGSIEYVNAAFEKLTGFSKGEAVGKNPRIVRSGKHDPAFYRRMWETILNGMVFSREFINRKKNGEFYWQMGTISPVKNAAGEITHFIGTGRDITAQKTAEERIRSQASLLDLAHDAIIVCDTENRIDYWNKGAERVFGWTATEVIGWDIRKLLCRADVDPASAREILLDRGNWHGELRPITRDGKELVLDSRWTLVRDDAGHPKSILTISTDITERKTLETQFLRAQRMENLGALASGLAHDLNNILAPVLLGVEVLREQRVGPEFGRVVAMLAANARRGAELVKQLLGFARGTEGGRVLVQPKHLLREIIQIVRETFPKSIQVRSNVPDDLWTLKADPTQVHQILLNLCVNARDAMPNGGVLSLAAENVSFDESSAGMIPDVKAGPHVAFRVEDTGHGIPESIRDRIFDPFFTTKEPGKGTGLGLSTVRGLVSGHEGRVEVTTKAGQGTVFRVFLPALPAVETRSVDLTTPTFPSGHGEVILVVDDETSVLEMTRKILTAHGYEVLVAANGTEAVIIFAQQAGRIRLVLTDVMMPFMDGPALARAVRIINPEIKVVFSSGFSSPPEENSTAKELEVLGVKDFLDKPYTADKLLTTIHRTLRKGKSTLV